ncbi:MAG: nucleotidyltransferase [Deltaproteobacteria bacterium]|nr:nucleotidyltransferase [Deltaproteobacteria bacterium]MDZ4341636.1 nucleotidyltransferase [Candidatus Binatia bacterium]
MEVQPDFKELLGFFNDHRVSYLIVGGYALAFHGAPRFTGDLDIFIKPDHENAQRIVAALGAFGFASLGLTAEDFERPDQVIQLGVAPVRIDLITSITGVSWDDAFTGRASSNFGGVPVHYIGREQFILNKRATGRIKDLADLEALGEK